MGILDDLLAADTIRFEDTGTGAITTSECVSKSTRSLDVLADTAWFGFTDSIEFTLLGEHLGDDPEGNPVLRWTTDQPMNLTRGPVHYKRLVADLMVTARAQTPQSSTRCDGNPASFGVLLTTRTTDLEGRPFTNHVTADVDLDDTHGFIQKPTTEAKPASLVAIAGKLALAPKIVLQRNECGIGPSPGQPATFTVALPPVTTRVDYAWTIAGATPLSATDASIFTALLGTTSGAVKVSVTVTVESTPFTANLTFLPETSRTIAAKERRCQLQKFIRTRLVHDPLPDPKRDLVDDPLSHHELTRLHDFATKLQGHAKALLDEEQHHTLPPR